MKIERIVYPVKTLGPGDRIGLWTIGCIHHCFNCINPELQVLNSTKDININQLAKTLIELAKEKNTKALTITGGDPLYQKEDLKSLLELIRPCFDDILVYTGYLREEIDNDYLKNIDVLIDGKYIDSLNKNDVVLRGSSNQVIWFLNPLMESIYIPYLKKGRAIQNILVNETLISVGIHNKLGGNNEI